MKLPDYCLRCTHSIHPGGFCNTSSYEGQCLCAWGPEANREQQLINESKQEHESVPGPVMASVSTLCEPCPNCKHAAHIERCNGIGCNCVTTRCESTYGESRCALETGHTEWHNTHGPYPYLANGSGSTWAHHVSGQPAPTPSTYEPSWPLVIADMRNRDDHGAKKYGERLAPMNGRDSLQNLYEELLDAVVYVKNRLRQEVTMRCEAENVLGFHQLSTNSYCSCCAQAFPCSAYRLAKFVLGQQP